MRDGYFNKNISQEKLQKKWEKYSQIRIANSPGNDIIPIQSLWNFLLHAPLACANSDSGENARLAVTHRCDAGQFVRVDLHAGTWVWCAEHVGYPGGKKDGKC